MSAPAREERVRQRCLECLRPLDGCVCATVPRVANRTPVYILQHPRERLHPFGSVRFARLGLERVAIDVFGESFAHLRRWSASPPPGAALLYPGPRSRELGTLAPSERPESLVVIDGTWSQAKGIVKREPWLQALPQVRVTPRAPGLYRIRREPALHCMSTIEAIVEALRVLEPETDDLDRLLASFTGMIDGHLALRAGRPAAPYRRLRTRRAQRTPVDAMGGRAVLERLVVAYAEMIRRSPDTQLVYVTALRRSDGAAFAAYLRPEARELDDYHLGRMRLSRADVERGVSLDETRAAWQAFVRPGDVIAAWSATTLETLAAALDTGDHATVQLKAAYCNLRRRSCGDLADVAREHGLMPAVTPFAGRAGERMGQALAVVDAIAAGAISAS